MSNYSSHLIGGAQPTNRVKKFQHKHLGIITYDTDNIYPQKVDLLLSGSSTGKTAVKRYSKHIIGQGFTDESFNLMSINRFGLTNEGLLRKIARSFAKHEGFALHFNFNVFGEWVELNFTPFKDCRLGLPDDHNMTSNIKLYNNWAGEMDKRFMKADIHHIDIWNPKPEVVQSQIERAGGLHKYKGQILYYGEDGQLKYPASPFDSVREDLETDMGIQVFKNSNVRNRFAGTKIITTPKFDDDKQRAEFQENIQEIQGPENTSTVMHFEQDDFGDESAKIQIDDIAQPSNDKQYQWHEQSVQNNIRKSLGVPPVMMGDFPKGGLGNIQEYENGFRVMNQITKDDRLMIQRLFSKIYQFRAFGGQPTNDFSINPLELDDNGNNNIDTDPIED